MTSFLRPLQAIAAFGAALCLTAAPASAQSDFPNRPVTIVTPFPAGSGPDAVLRLISERLGKVWKQQVMIENKPGAGGFIAIDAARRVPPNGHTLLQLDSEHLAALPHLYRQRNFVTLDVFEPVAALYRTPFLVAVSAQSKWSSMAELLSAAKAEPGKLNYGSWGQGSPGHLGAVGLEAATGAAMVHVPYRDMGQLFTSVATGELQWSFGSIPSSQGPYKAGRLKYLAVATPKRIPQMPELPTVAESGGPAGFELSSFVVLVAPKGMPPALRSRIEADVGKVMADPELKAQLDAYAFETLSWTQAEILRNAEAKSSEYQQLIRRANISLD
jgi:tripartite-type tricarboxylate transporter receptor subunit TctC